MSKDESEKKRDRSVSEADRRLFRESVGPLRRLRTTHQHRQRPREAPVPRFTAADERKVVDELLEPGSGEPNLGELLHHQPGVPPRTLKKLRRGQFRIDAEIDLHAMSERVARRMLLEFLEECGREGLRCVRVVHGKGLRSGHEGPVIKPMVERELSRRKQVLAFCSARPVHGGTGAVYVLLTR